jgi:hypothetical protein
VVSPTISVRAGLGAELAHQLVQHQRMRLARGLVGGARAVEHAVQFLGRQRLVEPATRLAGGHRQQVVPLLQLTQQRQHAVEQAQVVLVLVVVER